MTKKLITFLFLLSTYIHTITYVYCPDNRALSPKKDISKFWSVTEMFSDAAILMDGFFGKDRYGRMFEERVDWFDSYLDGPKWFYKTR